MAIYNYKENVNPNKDNYSLICTVDRISIKRKRINGKYEYEKFYAIDFYGIKSDSYIISSFGRVFSLLTNKELKTRKRKKSRYEIITLQTTNGPRTFMVHCLVARAFVPKSITDKKMDRYFVHHKNWDNDYNFYWNLEWRSTLEISIMHFNQLKREDISEEDIVKSVCKLLELGTPMTDIFDILYRRISKDKISKIKNRQIYTHISCNYHF